MGETLAVRYVDLDDLIPYARNARTHDDAQIAQIAASIREFGFTNPILVDGERGIIAGHGRVLAARKLGLARVPVIELAGMSDAQRRAYIIADNKLALNAGWDDELLKIELDELTDLGFDIALTGFSQDELDGMVEAEQLDPAEESDDIPEPPAEPVTQRGDVWKLGHHRIICGDCRDLNDLERVLTGRAINVAVTSPPYASQREYDPSSGFTPIPPDEYVGWYADVAANIYANLADDGSYFCNIKAHCDDGERHLYVMDLVIAHRRAWGWKFVDEFCWRNTKNGVPGGWDNRFKNAFEPVFHFAKAKAIKFRPLANGTQSDGLFDGASETSGTGSGLLGARDEYKEGIARPSNVLEIAASAESEHSAAYPVALPQWFIRAFSDEGDVIFDPFMGSGTTLIAAENEGRVAVGTEISRAYCDVIVRRWQNLTGKAATLDGDGRTFDEIAS